MALRLVLLARVLAALVLGAAALPGLARAADIEHRGAEVTVTGSDHGDVIWPGDSFSISEQVENVGAGDLTGVSGTLTGESPTVTVGDATSPWDDLLFGHPRANRTPFTASVSPEAECGARLPFALALTGAEGKARVPFSLPTGHTSAPTTHRFAGAPSPIPESGSSESVINVPQAGRIKDVVVRVESLEHSYTGDLRLELVAPDGTRVVLKRADNAPGEDFTDTTFADDGSFMGAASAPYTGRFRPAESLARLDGTRMQGAWKLAVADQKAPNAGQIVAWSLDLAHAECKDEPVANLVARPNPALPGEEVTLDASSSIDPSANITRYEFQVDGGPWTSNGADPTLTHTFAEAGVHEVRTRITDDRPTPMTDESPIVRVVVASAPTAALSASNHAPELGDPVTLSAADSTAPGHVLVSYEWDDDGDGTYDASSSTPTRTVRYDTPGSRRPRVRVTSDTGQHAVATLDEPVVVGNRAPAASFTTPAVPVTGATQTFTSTSSDPDAPLDSVASHAWSVTPAAGAAPQTSSTGSSFGVSFSAPGDYTVRLTVRDTFGRASTEALKTVHVTTPPVAEFTASPSEVSPGAPVVFDGRASRDPDADGTIRAWAWDFDGNGSWDAVGAGESVVTHAYAKVGTYGARLKVTDDRGASTVSHRTVVVRNLLPVAQLSASRNPVDAGVAVTFSAAGSADPDGRVVDYDWDLDGDGQFEQVHGGPTATASFPNPRNIRIGVRARDDRGGTAVRTLLLTVREPAAPADSGGTGTAGGGGGGSSAGTPITAPGRFLAVLGGKVLQRRKAVRERGLAATCRASRAGRCTVVARVSAADARRLGLRVRGRRPVEVARRTVRVAAGRTAAVRLRLNAAGRRLLAAPKLRRVPVRLSALAVDAGGRRSTAARVVLVRR